MGWGGVRMLRGGREAGFRAGSSLTVTQALGTDMDCKQPGVPCTAWTCTPRMCCCCVQPRSPAQPADGWPFEGLALVGCMWVGVRPACVRVCVRVHVCVCGGGGR